MKTLPLSFIFILLICVKFSTAQKHYTLLLENGYRTPEANAAQFISGFNVADEAVINGYFYKYIQFYDIPSDQDKTVLLNAGIDLLEYIPSYAYIASLKYNINFSSLSDISNIRSIIDIPLDDRLKPALKNSAPPVYALRSDGAIELTVSLFKNSTLDVVRADLGMHGWTISKEYYIGYIFDLIIPVTELHVLAGKPYVRFVTAVDAPGEPENMYARSLHRVNGMNSDFGAMQYDGSGVVVMMNDDGEIGPHIDFKGRLKANYAIGYGGDHGDHVAGTILGGGNLDPVGKGMAPGAELIVFPASNYPGFDSIYQHYFSMETRVTSTSYSNGCNAGYTTLAQIMDHQVRTLPGLMHVFSAGNNGIYDCGYGAGSGWGNITGGHKAGKNVMAVANLDYQDQLANSSSRGPAHDGRIKPDVAAMGTNVYSTGPSQTYNYKSGTSMACPGAAGTIATIIHAYKEIYSAEPAGGLIKAILMNSAEDLGNSGPDFKFGFGRINAQNALSVVENQQLNAGFLSHADSTSFTINVGAAKDHLRVMTYWTDYEGSVNTTKALVNDLDMKVIAPDGTVFYPWVLNHAPNPVTLDQPAVRAIDTINNVEQVTIDNPLPGNYTVKVYGTVIPFGPQPYHITWMYDDQTIDITYPAEREALVPGETIPVRWDTYGAAGTFALSYSVDGGSIWQNIAASLPGNERSYDWTVPQHASGNVILSVSRGAESDTTGFFTIAGQPANINIPFRCPDSLAITWDSVPGALGYVITRLGTTTMDSIAVSANNHAVIYNISPTTDDWFSVYALTANGGKGRKAVAEYKPMGLFNCPINYDVQLWEIVKPANDLYPGCQTGVLYDVEVRIKNNGLAAVYNFPISYQIDQQPVVIDTVSSVIAPGGISQFVFNTPVSLSGNGIKTLQVFTGFASDQYKGNDTLSVDVIIEPLTIQSPDYEDDFELLTLCSTASDCEFVSCDVGPLWANIPNGQGDDIDWRVNSGDTPSNTTGPDRDHKPGTISGKYLYLEASGNCYNKEAKLISSCIDLTNATVPVLSFWYHMYGSNMGRLHLDVLVDGAWINNVMPFKSGNQGIAWKNQMVDLSAYNGKIINVRFRGVTGNGYSSDLALDDIAIVETMGVEASSSMSEVVIYPNPTKKNLTIEGYTITGETLEIELLSSEGRLLYRNNYAAPAGKFSTTLEISGFGMGVYYLRIMSNGNRHVKKVILL